MATVDSRDIIDSLIAHNGFYPGDEHLPPVVKIIEYTTPEGQVTWGIVYENELRIPGFGDRYENGGTVGTYILSPHVIWRRSL